VSKTDLVNSGSYFFTDRVVVFGMTTFVGFGGSFFKIGLIAGFTDTKDFACASCFFKGAGCFAMGLSSGFFETGFTSCFFTAAFLAAGFNAPFLGADLAGFPLAGRAGLAIAFLVDAFFAGFTAPPTCRAGFLVAGFPVLCEAGFLVGIL
jgi:hypothetical protein